MAIFPSREITIDAIPSRCRVSSVDTTVAVSIGKKMLVQFCEFPMLSSCIYFFFFTLNKRMRKQPSQFLKKGAGSLAYSGYGASLAQNLKRQNSLRRAYGLTELHLFLRKGEGKMAWHAGRDSMGTSSNPSAVSNEVVEQYSCIIS